MACCEPAMLKYEAGYRDQMIDEIRQLCLDYMNDNVYAGLGAVRRLRSTLLVENQRAKLLELAERCAEVKAKVRLDGFRWEDGRIAVELTAELVYGPDGTPLPVLRRGDRYFIDPDLFPGIGGGDGDLLDVTAEARRLRADITVRHRKTGIEWAAAAESQVRIEEADGASADGASADGASADGASAEAGSVRCHAVLRATGRLDPQHGGDAPFIRGAWDVRVRVHFLGLARDARPAPHDAPDVEAHMLPALLGSPEAQLVIPYFTDPGGNLSLDVDRSGKSLGGALSGREALPLPGSDREIEVKLDIVATPGTAEAPASLVLRGRDRAALSCAAAGVLRPVEDRMHLFVDARQDMSAWAPSPPRPGVWHASARVDDGKKAPEVKLGRALVDGQGRLHMSETLGEVSADAVCRVPRSQVVRSLARKVVRHSAGPVARKLPPGPRRSLGRVGRKLGL